jgi:hypothetical protein
VKYYLQIVQWQVFKEKQNKLEFCMPWWDLQLDVSVNQFLLIFPFKNADFRQLFAVAISFCPQDKASFAWGWNLC